MGGYTQVNGSEGKKRERERLESVREFEAYRSRQKNILEPSCGDVPSVARRTSGIYA
jgi:hypothetical protein